jgi:threonine/homoserine/homoserine lactone efflux protein
MEWSTFPRGLVLGLAIAAPVGPIGLLTIRRTLAHGFRLGLATGLGAATADTTYGLVAAFGLTAIMSGLVEHADAIRIIGGIALLFLGGSGVRRTMEHRRLGAAEVSDPPSLIGAWAQTTALTLTNPATILSFIAMFAGIGIVEPGADVLSSLILVLGVALGSAIWWVFLCGLTKMIRGRLSEGAINAINLVASGSIVVFGLIAIWAGLF